MKLGILIADELENQVTRRYGNYAAMFERLLAPVDSTLEFIAYEITISSCPDDIDECDAYLITGSKSSCYEESAWISRLSDFVIDCNQSNKKLLGICFGHQLIAQALGGKVQKNESGWGIGVSHSEIIGSSTWLQPHTKQFTLLVSHQDQVTELPSGAALVAGNDFCPIGSYQIGEHVLTFQGHPEFNLDYLQHIMTKRRDVIGERAYHHAMRSFGQAVDNELVANWMCRFIRY